MADYERVTLRAVFSANDDYTYPKHDTDELSTTATPEHVMVGEIQVNTGGTTLVAGSIFVTGDTFILKNLDTTNYVTLTIRDSTDETVSVVIPAGGLFHLSGWEPGTAVVAIADTAGCQVKFWASGTYG